MDKVACLLTKDRQLQAKVDQENYQQNLELVYKKILSCSFWGKQSVVFGFIPKNIRDELKRNHFSVFKDKQCSIGTLCDPSNNQMFFFERHFVQWNGKLNRPKVPIKGTEFLNFLDNIEKKYCIELSFKEKILATERFWPQHLRFLSLHYADQIIDYDYNSFETITDDKHLFRYATHLHSKTSKEPYFDKEWSLYQIKYVFGNSPIITCVWNLYHFFGPYSDSNSTSNSIAFYGYYDYCSQKWSKSLVNDVIRKDRYRKDKIFDFLKKRLEMWQPKKEIHKKYAKGFHDIIFTFLLCMKRKRMVYVHKHVAHSIFFFVSQYYQVGK